MPEIDDWAGEEITHSEHIYQYENDLFDDDGARKYLNIIIENMEFSEILDVLRDFGMEDVTKEGD